MARIYKNLAEFLVASENTVTRERLLFHKLCFDLYTAAARSGYPLTVFSPEVDREGFDLVLDDGDYECRLQLKSILATSRCRRWDTTKRFLRPELKNAGFLGLELSPEGVGVGGGVILIECDPARPELSVRYHFTDLTIIALLSKGWVLGRAAPRAERADKTPRNPGEQARDLILDLSHGSGRDELPVPIAMFVATKGPDELLALMGMHSAVNTSVRMMSNIRLGHQYDPKQHGRLEDEIRREISLLIQA